MSDETEMTEENVELSELRAKLEKLAKDNREIEKSLIQQGVAPKYEVIMMMKLDLLATFVLGSGADRFEFEIESQKRIKDMLMQIQQQIHEQRTQSKLLVPNQNPLQIPGVRP